MQITTMKETAVMKKSATIIKTKYDIWDIMSYQIDEYVYVWKVTRILVNTATWKVTYRIGNVDVAEDKKGLCLQEK